MNTLRGKIIELLHEDELVIVKIDIKGEIFSVLMLDMHSLKDLQVGTNIGAVFKEHELSFALPSCILSVENTFLAKIKSIKRGKLLYHIFFDFKGDIISSIISKERALELRLKEDDEWLCFVKPNDVVLKIIDG